MYSEFYLPNLKVKLMRCPSLIWYSSLLLLFSLLWACDSEETSESEGGADFGFSSSADAASSPDLGEEDAALEVDSEPADQGPQTWSLRLPASGYSEVYLADRGLLSFVINARSEDEKLILYYRGEFESMGAYWGSSACDEILSAEAGCEGLEGEERLEALQEEIRAVLEQTFYERTERRGSFSEFSLEFMSCQPPASTCGD